LQSCFDVRQSSIVGHGYGYPCLLEGVGRRPPLLISNWLLSGHRSADRKSVV
jgi:hypothetical protein